MTRRFGLGNWTRFTADTSVRLTAIWVALGLVAMWSFVLNVLTLNVNNAGKQTFVFLLILCDLVIAARVVKPRTSVPNRTLNAFVCVLAFLVSVPFLLHIVPAYFSSYHSSPVSDIPLDTLAAGRHEFDLKQNPYTTDCQLWGDPTHSPNVTKIGSQLYMFGIPYDFGYAYFPGMFLTYEPFRRIDRSIASIRLANGIFYVATLVALAWLTALLVPKGSKFVAGTLAVAALLCTWILGQQYFRQGTTDVIIPAFALYGFIAASYGRPSMAGILFGWTLACKLLPGAFFCLIVGAWFWRRPERWKFLLPMVATVLAVLVPYIARNPPAFLSSTILFYLTFHATGDDTALYFFVPSEYQLPYLLAGYALVLILAIMAVRRKMTLLGTVAASFILFVVFIATSKMDHPNYLMAIAPLGCVALVGYALKDSSPQTDGANTPEGLNSVTP